MIKELLNCKMALIVQDKNGNYFLYGVKNWERKQKIKRIYDRRF
jgi:hypothetical protein